MSVQSFNHLYRLLVEPKTLYSRIERKLIRDLRYHLAEPGDVIIQPPCYAHCVLTGCSSNTDGTVRWALVHGWEGNNVNYQERANRVFEQFSSGAGKGFIRQWLDRYGLDQLVKLLEVREWRVALQQWNAAQFLRLEKPLVCSVDSEEPTVWSFLYRRDVLEHCEAFQAVGYDLIRFLRHSNPRNHSKSRKKNRRLANFGKAANDALNAPNLTSLSEVELLEFPLSVFPRVFELSVLSESFAN